MIFRNIAFLFILNLSIAYVCTAQIDSTIIPGHAKQFEMANFDEQSGYKDWEIFGDEGTYVSDDKILVNNMKVDIFDGSQKAEKRFEITSPYADVFTRTKSAGGDGMLYVRGDAFKMEGKTWLWESTGKKISVYNGLTIYFKESENKPDSTVVSKEGFFCHLGNDNIFEFSKSVKVRGSDTDIDCENLKITADKKASSKDPKSAKNIEASNKVFLVWKDEKEALADKVLLNPSSEVAQMFGNAQITDINSKTKIFGEKIILNKVSKKIESFGSAKKKAKTSIVKNDNGKEENVDIFADKIVMNAKGEQIFFDFFGNVEMRSSDIKAKCKKMNAVAEKKNGEEKYSLSKVKGEGNAWISQNKRSASSQEFEYYPEKSEIWLNKDAYMGDSQRGIFIDANAIILLKDENRALAFSKKGDDKSYVVVRIIQSASNKIQGKNVSQATIKSRQLLSVKDGNATIFNFTKDVSINSGDMDAVCNKMEVYARNSAKGKMQIEKIEAFDDIIITQNQYMAKAQLAKIYPKVEMSDEKGKASRTFTELLTREDMPNKRPQIILPPIGNIGLNESMKSNAVKKSTIIESDKQALVEGEKNDRYFFEGNVMVDSSDMKATCEKIEVVMSQKDTQNQKIDHIIATENVKILQENKEAAAGRADIFPEEEMISLSENPSVLNKENNSRAYGHRMTYRKGKKGVSIEGADPSSDSGDTKYKRPTIILPPIGG